MRSDDHQRVMYGSEIMYLPYCSPKCLSEDPEKGEYEKIVQRFNSSGGKEEYNRKKAIEDQQWEQERAIKEKKDLRDKKIDQALQVIKALFYIGLAAYIFYAC
jgi:hypothetical protein